MTSVESKYHMLSGLFGLVYGAYSLNAFIYIEKLLSDSSTAGAVNGDTNSSLTSLLGILTLTMIFEAFAEPLTGGFADSRGRRLSVVVAFSLISISFFLYGALQAIDNLSGATGIVFCSIIAELFLAIGLAFHSGSLEAWFVDASDVHDEVNLERVFASNATIFSVGSFVGASTGLYFSAHGGYSYSLLWLSLGVGTGLLAFIAGLSIDESSYRESGSDGDSRKAIGLSKSMASGIIEIFSSPKQSLSVILMSASYVVQVVFMYFAPLYLFHSLKDDPNFTHSAMLIVIPLLLYVPRIAGGVLSRFAAKFIPKQSVRVTTLSLLPPFFLALTGLLVLVLGKSDFKIFDHIAIGSLALCWLTWFCARPVQSAILNAAICSSRSRAFVNSMTVPVGAIVVAVLSLTLMLITPKAFQSSSLNLTHEVGLLFLSTGTFCSVVTAWSTRRISRLCTHPASEVNDIK